MKQEFPLRGAIAILLALIALRLVGAAITPIAFDEAYYWTWSKHLASGYYDHPPMVAIVIRLGTMIFGDTPLGVRFVSVLLGLPMTYAVYRTAEILFASRQTAAGAAVLLNATLVAAAGTMIVTPDAPLMVASAFVLFFLAKIYQTGNGAWWLAVGIAVGAALYSKYTALFFGLEILLWLLLAPRMRHWLVSPWPYVGGILAFSLFAPVILWNANHEWVSFAKQLGRARMDQLTLRFIGELLPAQVMFATPAIFVLGVMGLYALARSRTGNAETRTLIAVSVGTILIYFLIHSLHARVEANWLGPIYPAFAIAAAAAADQVSWGPRVKRFVKLNAKWAVPGGSLLLALLIVQANTGLLSGFRRDPTVRSIGVGWPDLAREIETKRREVGATCVVAADYGTTSWLKFYLPKGTCVEQPGERIRWVNMPPLDAEAFAGRSLLVDEVWGDGPIILREACSGGKKVGEAQRKRGPLVIETYKLVLIDCRVADMK